MAKKTTKANKSQGVRKSISTLIKKGLYRPKRPRAKPTKYGKSLLRRFLDVLTGKASVVTAKPARGKGKGVKQAREYGKGAGPGTVRAVRNKIIVPTQGGEVARYSKKKGTVAVTRRVGRVKYVREPFKRPVRSIGGLKQQLKDGERVSIPLYRGSKGVEWVQMTLEEFEQFWAQYGPKGTATYETAKGKKKKKRFRDLGDHIQAFRVVQPKDADA